MPKFIQIVIVTLPFHELSLQDKIVATRKFPLVMRFVKISFLNSNEIVIPMRRNKIVAVLDAILNND